MPQGARFDINRELAFLRGVNPFLDSALSKIVEAINRVATNVGASAVGELPPPPPVDSTAIQGTLVNNVLTVPGEILHFVHTHNAPLLRSIQYVT